LEFEMKHWALLSIALAQLLALPALAKTPYDGTWDVAVQTKAGTCESLARYRLFVQDGRIFGPGDVSGRVTNDGYVRVSINGSHANGQLDSRSGSGRWNAASAGAPCSGKWKATRE
jgi:hypothetical protein